MGTTWTKENKLAPKVLNKHPIMVQQQNKKTKKHTHQQKVKQKGKVKEKERKKKSTNNRKRSYQTRDSTQEPIFQVKNKQLFLMEKQKRKRLITNKSKSRVVMMFSYNGNNYSGLKYLYGKKKKNTKTIELELLKALNLNKFIKLNLGDNLKKIGWSRSCCTEKGVNALRQYVSFKMQSNFNEQNTVNQINQKLPNDIRVWGLRRVPKSFNCHKKADSRVFRFILPTFLLVGKNIQLYQFQSQSQSQPNSQFVDNKIRFDNFNEQALDYLNNEIFSKFVNSTCINQNNNNISNSNNKIRHSNDNINSNSIDHYKIKTMIAEQPQIIDGIEFTTIKIHSKMFFLHQIRFLITLAVLIMRGTLQPEILIGKNLHPKSFNLKIELIPSIGLVLERVFYENYNKQKDRGLKNGEIHFNAKDLQINSFLNSAIITQIIGLEKERHIFKSWLDFYSNSPIENIFNEIN
ncbi:tRNA pseudouridine synthase a [Anaeramoeba flamelloides]|uniref:tRNA pseudouridine synthase a n=1 Tax=Anaeramoeba flamelloides TaxID=1746091 RepID=A0ABQ8XRG6_9EUKA|nr:tRNA pseudouridine synthase a [Anaeramoeba flamelloides]